jgi:Ca2+-binding RTX toxin-like protein
VPLRPPKTPCSKLVTAWAMSQQNVARQAFEQWQARNDYRHRGQQQAERHPRRRRDRGAGGNDNVSGLAGNDTICGGAGKDNLKGGGGKDTLLGQKGKDTLKGAGGKDLCKGGKGEDSAFACEVEKSI